MQRSIIFEHTQDFSYVIFTFYHIPISENVK